MRETKTGERPSRAKVVAAFAAVYVFWGSTYLAIRYGIETIPPFLMAGTRFVIAGVVLYIVARLRDAPRPERHQWAAAAVIGGLLLAAGNGMVVWSEQRVASGLAALLVSITPLWMVLIDWARRDGDRPSGQIWFGLALGFVGMGILVGPAELAGGERVDLIGAAGLLCASVSWATGSIYSRKARLPESPLMATAMEMLAGGTLLLVGSAALGEWNRFHLGAISTRSAAAVGYLIVFGSLVGFTAYMWLLRVTTPARASTYAYVNPVVAVFLGWAIAGEPLTLRTLLAAAVIVVAVVIITTYRTQAEKEAQQLLPTPAKTVADQMKRTAAL